MKKGTVKDKINTRKTLFNYFVASLKLHCRHPLLITDSCQGTSPCCVWKNDFRSFLTATAARDARAVDSLPAASKLLSPETSLLHSPAEPPVPRPTAEQHQPV